MFLVVSGSFRQNSITHCLCVSLDKAEEFISQSRTIYGDRIISADWLDIREFTSDDPSAGISYPRTVASYWWDSREGGGWVNRP